jgi:hypothetical protein
VTVHRQLVRRGRRGAWAIGLVVVAFGWALIQQRTFFFTASPIEASHILYGIEPFPEAVTVAQRLVTLTDPKDRILVWGAEPEIYFYAHRRSATGYIYLFGIWEENRYSARMAREMMREVEATPPKYIVLEFLPVRLMAEATPYLAKSYVLDGRVEIFSPERTEYYGGDQVAKHALGSLKRLLIFRRKDAPDLSSSK